jgi:REP element-mobilizing transposase RayT
MTDRPPASGPYNTVHHRLPGFDYADPDAVYFLTLRARTGTPFTDPRLADEVIASLQWLRKHRGITLYAYCLMPDHLHLLLQLPENEQGTVAPAPSGRPRPAAIADPKLALGTLIGSFKSFTTNRSWKLGRRGLLWQVRYYDHIVRKTEDGRRIAQYIIENPVRKGVVADPDDYPYSGMPDPLE